MRCGSNCLIEIDRHIAALILESGMGGVCSSGWLIGAECSSWWRRRHELVTGQG